MQVQTIWVPALATLVAAFFGAFFAYIYQNKLHKDQEVNEQYAAANKAMFNMFQMLNSIRLIQKDFLDPVRGQSGAMIEMMALMPENPEDYGFDFNGLSFLLNTNHRQLLLDLHIEQQTFREAIKALNYRSALHKNIVQPQLSRANFKNGEVYSGEYFKAALGEHLFLDLKNATDIVFISVDKSVKTLQVVKEKMVKVFKELFPGKKILNIELLEEKPAN